MSDATYSDDSFRIDDPKRLVVTGTLPGWSELRWHPDLSLVVGGEVKWTKVRARWRDLSTELRRSILRDLRDAFITIVDGSLYHQELEQAVEKSVRHPKESWPAPFRAWMTEHSRKYEMQRILDDSPASRIQDYLEDDGDILGDPGGIAGNTDLDRSVMSDLFTDLKNPHNARLFGTRAGVAFSPLVDREDMARVLARLHDVRYFVTPERLVGELLAEGERTQRIFDKGNETSVASIQSLKTAIRKRLKTSGTILLADDLPAGTAEEDSLLQPLLQIGDLAGGYARQIYLDYGLQAVCEEFRAVMHNGEMIRTWSQIERVDGELRPRKR